MPKASFQHALNDGEITVNFSYDWFDTGCCEIETITFNGTDITAVVHPEDFTYLQSLVAENAAEDKAESIACAQEARWEADREEQLCA